ncbi:hypothetical protein ASG39_07205 [Rhizobium sp. Leaf371]|nr:hypothetical protein ASG39_07205 [Rhizobium sp. Leaf371]
MRTLGKCVERLDHHALTIIAFSQVDNQRVCFVIWALDNDCLDRDRFHQASAVFDSAQNLSDIVRRSMWIEPVGDIFNDRSVTGWRSLARAVANMTPSQHGGLGQVLSAKHIVRVAGPSVSCITSDDKQSCF